LIAEDINFEKVEHEYEHLRYEEIVELKRIFPRNKLQCGVWFVRDNFITVSRVLQSPSKQVYIFEWTSSKNIRVVMIFAKCLFNLNKTSWCEIHRQVFFSVSAMYVTATNLKCVLVWNSIYCFQRIYEFIRKKNLESRNWTLEISSQSVLWRIILKYLWEEIQSVAWVF